MKKFFKDFIKFLSNIDKKILKIMNISIIYSSIFCILGSIVLLAYECFDILTLFYVGISIFKSGLFFMVTCTVFGFAFDKILHELG